MREIKYRQTDKKDLLHFQGNLFSVLTFLALFSVLNAIKALLIKFPQVSQVKQSKTYTDLVIKYILFLLSKQQKKSGGYLKSQEMDSGEGEMHENVLISDIHGK